MNILHLIFRPSLTAAQSQNPRRSPATPAVSFNRYSQIWPKSERYFVQLIIASLLNADSGFRHRGAFFDRVGILSHYSRFVSSRLLKIYCGAGLRRCRSLKSGSVPEGTPRFLTRLRLADQPPHDVFQQPVKEASNNNMNILHLIFRPSLTAAQSQNPRRSPATPAVLFNRYSQI